MNSCGTILLIDSDPRILNPSEQILELMGYEVLPAQGVTDARRVLEEQRPDVVVSDIILKDGKGIELAREIRERYPHIPIIFLLWTIEKTDELVMKLFAEGYECNIKPCNFTKLQAHIDELIHRRERSGYN